MNVRTDIYFHPDSLGDISDFMTVATEGGDFKIPLLAKRNPPQLNIPSTIDIGTYTRARIIIVVVIFNLTHVFYPIFFAYIFFVKLDGHYSEVI